MIGGGVFSLTQNMAKGVSPGAVIFGWLITGIGMLALAFVYQTLSTRKPKLDAGPYAYAHAEDRDTRARFGIEFDAYAGRVPAFLPTQRAATRTAS